MTNQKNSLATLSREQSNPYLCDPNSWEIVRDGNKVFTGQSSEQLRKQADAECNRRPAKRSTATEVNDAAPSETGRL
jgi:hypothetical protein